MEDLQKDCKYYVHIGMGVGGYCEKHLEKGRVDACKDCKECEDYEKGKERDYE